MASGYYIRIRGKSQGPFSTDQLRAFVQRGQLSRLHELSTDGLTWAGATNYPELFANGQATPVVDPLVVAPDPAKPLPLDATYDYDISALTGPAAKDNRQPPPALPDAWYYTRNGAECGPVGFAALQALIASGNLGASDVVWRDGMADWAPPQTIPGLIPNAQPAFNVFDQAMQGPRKYCHQCGNVIASLAEICPRCGVRQQQVPEFGYHRQSDFTPTSPGRKSKVAAALFALFLGGLGLHKFYLGEVGWGILYLLFCWTFIPAVVATIEAILYLTMSDQEFARRYD